jgi:hypothetical protein
MEKVEAATAQRTRGTKLPLRHRMGLLISSNIVGDIQIALSSAAECDKSVAARCTLCR